MAICDLSMLEKLDLSHNLLDGLPAVACRLQCLADLNLSGNDRLTCVPPVVGALRSLERLRFVRCRGIDTLPPQLVALSSLKELDCHETPLTLPPYALIELGGLKALRDFYAIAAARTWWTGRACDRILDGQQLAPEILELIGEFAHERGTSESARSRRAMSSRCLESGSDV